MNASTRRRLRWFKSSIESRLGAPVECDQEKAFFRSDRVCYEISERVRASGCGGIGLMHQIARATGLAKEIDRRLHLLKLHLPYHESDHVLNLAYNTLAGGTCIEDLELVRNDESYLDMLGVPRIPDPTTAGDFCRRFEGYDIEALMDAINETRLRVWRTQPDDFFAEARIDADGTLAPTTAECKQGMEMTRKGIWGYHPLVVSLANTDEPLYLVNRGGARPSQEGAAERFDQAAELVRRAGFRKITFRGDADFSQCRHLDRWNDGGIEFVFGFDAHPNLCEIADNLPKRAWKRLQRSPRHEVKTEPRWSPPNVKERIVREREYLNLKLQAEHVAEFDYRPSACKQDYRMIVLRKRIRHEKGQKMLFEEYRYFFYITNKHGETPSQIVRLANERCDQERLIEQLKNGIHAMRMPVDNLVSNWAYMVMASLAWTLKAWFALLVPAHGRWAEQHRAEKAAVLRMRFRTFLNAFMRIPAQVVSAGRRTVLRLLAWNPWQHVFCRTVSAVTRLRLA